MKISHLFFAGSFTLLMSCATKTSENNISPTKSEVTESQETVAEVSNIAEDITPEVFKQKTTEAPGLILDVRTADEFNSGHIDNAVNIDFYGENFDIELDGLDKEMPVYVYCRSGGRSGKTKDKLVAKGFKTVYNLNGGYNAWPYK